MFIGHMCVDILQSIAVLSVTFCLIGLAGLIGNLLVIVVIVTNKKMRHSATNLFIANLAVADLVITIRRLSAPIVSTEHAITGSCD